MRRRCEEQVSKLEDEDASLSLKQSRVQTAIDEAQGDYRNVEARTKELDGIAKRRSALEEELSVQGEELEKIAAVENQVKQALAVLKEREEAATASFQKQGGSLKGAITKLEQQRVELSAALSDELRASYDRIATAHGGVAIGVLKGDRCGTCRVPLDAGRLAEVKRQAPLATCPHCKRLLVIG